MVKKTPKPNLSKKYFFSIVAPNYVNVVSALADSLLKNIDNSFFYIIVVEDCPNSQFTKTVMQRVITSRKFDSLSIINLSEIDWPSEFNPYFAANRYDLIEFCTAIKPSVFLHLFKIGHKRVTYLDPDIEIFSDFTKVIDENCGISLTPHIFTPYPIDKFVPSALTILNAGIYNLGFISAGVKSLDFMKWWARVLSDGCYMQIQNGMHVDQKWVDLAPVFTDVQIVQEKGINVAYWNLHERKIKVKQGKYRVVFNKIGSTSLYFFHYSGFVPNKFGSKHSTRVLLKFSDLGLKKLFREYKKKISGSVTFDWDFANRKFGKPLSAKYRRILQAITLKAHDENSLAIEYTKMAKKEVCRICQQPIHKFPVGVSQNLRLISKYLGDN
jgi:hypothetical protein